MDWLEIAKMATAAFLLGIILSWTHPLRNTYPDDIKKQRFDKWIMPIIIALILATYVSIAAICVSAIIYLVRLH